MTERREKQRLPAKQGRRQATGSAEQRRSVAPSISWMMAVQLIAIITVALIASELAWLVARPLALFFLAIVLAEALAPFVVFLTRWLPRTSAVVLLYTGLIVVGAGIGFVTVPTLIDQTQEVISRGPELVAAAEQWLEQWDRATGGRFNDEILNQLDRLAGSLIGSPLAVFEPLFEILLVVFMSLYWLIAVPKLGQFTLARIPARHREPGQSHLNQTCQPDTDLSL